MHSGGLELAKLTHLCTRLEDNLIRHRGDRLMNRPPGRQAIINQVRLQSPAAYCRTCGTYSMTRTPSSTTYIHLVRQFAVFCYSLILFFCYLLICSFIIILHSFFVLPLSFIADRERRADGRISDRVSLSRLSAPPSPTTALRGPSFLSREENFPALSSLVSTRSNRTAPAHYRTRYLLLHYCSRCKALLAAQLMRLILYFICK